MEKKSPKRGPKISLEAQYGIKLMAEPGMTQKRAAALCGLSQQTLSYHMRKTQNSTQDTKSVSIGQACDS